MDSNFVDYVKIYCRSGKGGRGSMHLRHVKYQPNGGPDGGDGGKGGSVILRGNHNYWTLLHLKYQRHVFAENGGNGGRDKCHGTDGKDIYIDVPCGTVVYNAETGKYVCDVTATSPTTDRKSCFSKVVAADSATGSSAQRHAKRRASLNPASPCRR